MNKQIVVTGAILGLLAVITGAFGAHGLKAVLSPGQLATWHTAVQYHFYHVFALLFLSTFSNVNNTIKFIGCWLFSLGILLFSGSLYLLSCKDVLGITWVNVLGPVTPVGGLLFMGGWVTIIVAAVKNK